MNNFRKEYRETQGRVDVPEITAMDVMDEERRRKQRRIWRRRRFAAAAGTACALLVCMTGTAAAVNYTKSIIRVTDSGFSIVDDATAQRSAAGNIGEDVGGNSGGDAGEEYGGGDYP